MNRGPKQMRQEASDDRRQAEELIETDPTYSGYLFGRAAWKEYLASRAEQEAESTSKEAGP